VHFRSNRKVNSRTVRRQLRGLNPSLAMLRLLRARRGKFSKSPPRRPTEAAGPVPGGSILSGPAVFFFRHATAASEWCMASSRFRDSRPIVRGRKLRLSIAGWSRQRRGRRLRRLSGYQSADSSGAHQLTASPAGTNGAIIRHPRRRRPDREPGARCYADLEMRDRPKLATIECSICSAWIEVYPQDARDGPTVAWNMRDEELCKSPPAGRCPQVRAEIKRRFPDFDR